MVMWLPHTDQTTQWPIFMLLHVGEVGLSLDSHSGVPEATSLQECDTVLSTKFLAFHKSALL
jgi:hypothetical protein